ncbi:bifunctional nicotinamidase/pyrazinamidase [Bremerella cremea]|uniref:Nicotinamidase n=1 Tax=Bremerella cremea TaxID=1031537 RepID=A0A368KWD8_9BACT|nr:bifunctional nicotinamidase/pyrazinamidase [Bremerella cremea]RCS53945.1 bifunctional nicotinamidase/pyrazinamidase [Bremerella cremea]
MIALLLVDIQNDFLPGGALAVSEGDQVISVANRLMPGYPLVVATKDWHPAHHKSFASQHLGKKIGDVIELEGLTQVLWPDHCIQGTSGAEFAPGLNVGGIDHVVTKGTDPQIDSYSGFFDNARLKKTGLEDYLHSAGVNEVHIVGLATDYCVKFTALDAVELGFKTTVILEGVRGVELQPGDCAAAITTMAKAGIRIQRKENDDHRILFNEGHLRRVLQLRSISVRDRRSRLPD